MRYRLQYLYTIFFLLYPFCDSIGKSHKIVSLNIRLETKKDSLNPWNIRRGILIGFILKNELEIVCMQEVLPQQYHFFVDNLLEYSSVYAGRGDKSGEGVPIFFKRKVYDCLESGTFGLSEHPDSVGEKGWDARHPRIATWVKLKNKKNGKILCVINTHLDHVGKDARKNGMMTIKKRIKNLAQECPVVITGDMNNAPNTETIKIAMTAYFPMYDAYKVAKKRKGVVYTYHRFGKMIPVEARHRSDYVFVSESIKVKSVIIPREDRDEQTGVFMTDHCPVIADLIY